MGLIKKNALKINSKFFEFINEEVLQGTGIKSEDFWYKFHQLVKKLMTVLIFPSSRLGTLAKLSGNFRISKQKIPDAFWLKE